MSGTVLFKGFQIKDQREEIEYVAYEKEREAKKLKEAKMSKELGKFLKYVAEGEQDKAENLLKNNHKLTLQKGDLMDLSKRRFKGITGFQYALWALDWHMWRMILNYLPKEAAALQLAELEAEGTVYGKHFNLAPLVEALNMYTNKNGSNQHWCKVVGRNQLLLPTHIVNQYCNPARGFYPCPDFTEEVLIRSRRCNMGEWFTCEYNGQKLGDGFGVLRYNFKFAEAWRKDELPSKKTLYSALSPIKEPSNRNVAADVAALERLWEIRLQQLNDLKSELEYLNSVKNLLKTYFPSMLASTVLEYCG